MFFPIFDEEGGAYLIEMEFVVHGSTGGRWILNREPHEALVEDLRFATEIFCDFGIFFVRPLRK